MKLSTIIITSACIVIGGVLLSDTIANQSPRVPQASDCIQDAGEQALRECLEIIIEWQEAEALLADNSQNK